MVYLRLLYRKPAIFVLTLVLLVTSVITSGNASAEIGRNEGSWNIDSNGTTVRAEIGLNTDGSIRVGGKPTLTSKPSYSECEFRLVEIALWYDALEVVGEPPTGDSVPYHLFCGTALVDSFWVSPQDVIDYDAIAWEEAKRYVEEVLAPNLDIETNPSAYAITGVPSWFWVNGWNGATLNTAVSAPFGASVDVTLRLIDVEWNFGDNTNSIRANLGLAYPEESPVQHNYERRSTSNTNPNGTYQVGAIVNIAPSYRLNGGSEIALSPNLTVNLQTAQIVRQLQAVLTQPQR